MLFVQCTITKKNNTNPVQETQLVVEGWQIVLRTQLGNKLHFRTSGSVVLNLVDVLNGFLDKCLQ